MAIYHLSASIIKRSAGRNVTAAAAYRAGSKIEDLTTGIVHDYTRKQGVDYSEILSPISLDAIGNRWLLDREQIWNKVEEIEKRKDAQLAREITIAIPVELDRASQIELVREYVRANYVDRGMIADINLHHLNGNNPHAHILLTMRNLQTSPKGEVEFGLKNTDWNSKELLLAQRQNWEKVANKYLAAAGLDARIDCRCLKEQGSPFIPQIHVGIHATAMKRKGIATDRSEEFDRIEAENNDIRARLEEIYQRESALELELERNEDHRIGELLYQNIKSYQPIDNEDKNRQAISINRYIISKNLANGIKVRVDKGSALLSFKLEGDTWAKTISYPDRYSKTKYTRSDIDKLVEDFNKVVENFSSEIERNRNEMKRIKNEVEQNRDRGRDRNQENEVGESISSLTDRLGTKNFYLTSTDTYSSFYKSGNRIRVYTDSDIEPIYDFKLINGTWINQLKIYTGQYSLDNLNQIVTAQHDRFARGEIQKLDLTPDQLSTLGSRAFERRLDLRAGRTPPLPLNIAPPIRYYCTNEQTENIVKWSINTKGLDLSDHEPRKVVLNSNGLVQVTAEFEYYYGKNIVYRVEEVGKKNGAYWMIRVDSETKEILKHYGVASKLVLKQVEEIEKAVKEWQAKQIDNIDTDLKIDVISNVVAEPAVIDLVPESDRPAKQVSEEPSTPSNLTEHELVLLKIQQQNEKNAKEYLRKKAEQPKSQAKRKPTRGFER